MDTDNKRILQRFLELCAQGERAAAAALMDDAIEVHEAASLPFGGVHRGKDGFFALVKRVFRQWDDVRLQVDSLVAEGDTVLVLAELSGRGRQTGEAFSMPLAEVWTFREGRIVAVRPYYFDTARLIAL